MLPGHNWRTLPHIRTRYRMFLRIQPFKHQNKTLYENLKQKIFDGEFDNTGLDTRTLQRLEDMVD